MNKKKSIVSAEWLHKHLEAPDIKILDGSWYLPTLNRQPKLEYNSEHIPGALFFDVDEVCDLESDLPHMLPSPEKFASRVMSLGIGDGHRVVVYDGHGLFSAARVWWMFKVFGFEDIVILDGGMPLWKKAGFEVSSKVKSVQKYHFTARKNSLMIADSRDVESASSDEITQILDARTPERFFGKVEEPRPGLRRGHIPNSVNIPFQDLLKTDGTLKSDLELKFIFDNAGINLSKPIVTSCGSGVTAAILNLALESLGAKRVSLYDGSWCEWGRDAKFEVEV